jgi:GNAT superfamily N-acetyltransferase
MSNPRRRFLAWLEARDGIPPTCPATGIKVEQAPADRFALRAWHDDRGVLLCVKEEWLTPARRVASQLNPTELFSPFGTYELARFTLPDGLGVWGPTWCYIGDASTLDPATDERVRALTGAERADVDPVHFWHSAPTPDAASFGVFESGRLVAHSVAWPRGDEVWEIGLDALPDAKSKGLGKAVFDAASRWILAHNGLVIATTAPWNVPSVRTLRRCGLRHVLSELRDMPAPMRVPPQTLGAPLPGAELRNYYPDWAQNHDVLPREPSSEAPADR